MKTVILVGDGMADYPLEEFGGKTPLEIARTPAMDECARRGACGRVRTVPRGMDPGSDVANMSILGLDPTQYYTGRGPFEAASMGITVGEDEVAFRCNLVTVHQGKMVDYSAGHISSSESAQVIEFLNQTPLAEGIQFYPGVSYRNLALIKESCIPGYEKRLRCVPPHDISGQPYEPNLPSGEGSFYVREVMLASRQRLAQLALNEVRVDLKENPVNMIWLWGFGKLPDVMSLEERFAVRGGIISAVDLIKGLGIALGLKVINVPGATGYYDTNYQGKAEYALNALQELDFVYVHVEAPDEAGHNGDLAQKVHAIENFDEKVVATVLRGLEDCGDYRILLLPDHATPVQLRTHVADPVPFVLCGTGIESDEVTCYSEEAVAKGAYQLQVGHELIEKLFMVHSS